MQQYADELPQAQRYSTDQLAVYGDLLWPDTPQGEGSTYVVSYGKEQRYTIESINADLRTYAPTHLRTYLGRLKRRSRCFSRSIEARRRAIRLFVWYYNRRRRAYLANPHLKGNLCLYY
jgi:IS1 family transposase